MGNASMNRDRQQEKIVEITSASEILPLVRRNFTSDLARSAIILGIVILVGDSLIGSSRYIYLFPVFLVVAMLLTYVKQYAPIATKHDSLVRMYGDVYIEEVAAAVNRHGIRRLIKTRWFETYAEETCRRSSGS